MVQSSKSAWKAVLREYLEAIATSVVLAALIMTFVARTYAVDGSSMVPTLQNRERLLVEKVTYRFKAPQRGDIIVLRPPFRTPAPFIKRVIGIPGDNVYIHDGQVFLNGEALREDYLGERIQGEFGPYVVPPGSYFVLGDNRNHSEDSRFLEVGYVPKSRIVGRAVFRTWPLTELGTVQKPAVFRLTAP